MKEFRIYDLEKKEYVEELVHRIIVSKSGLVYNTELDEWYKPNERYVIEFFTGSYDRNETKIFEGDIIKITQHYYDCAGVDTHKAEVIFYENHSCFGYTSKDGYFSMLVGQGLEIEVIGNKYDVRI